MDELKDRVAVITGGGSGIGAEMARVFAREGVKIALVDLDEKGMEAVKKEVESAGSEAIAVRTDVSKLDEMRALGERVLDRFGAVHIVCNNAGVAVGGPLAEMTHKDWQWTIDVDLWGVVHGIEVFWPRMIEQKQGGHVVNTASMAGLAGMDGLGVYCAAKFAVVGLTESLHREGRAHGIGASVLCPMIVETNINESARNRPEELRNEGDQNQEVQTTYGRTIPVSEVGPRVLQAVRDNDLYILTHWETGRILERRAKKLADAVAKYATA